MKPYPGSDTAGLSAAWQSGLAVIGRTGPYELWARRVRLGPPGHRRYLLRFDGVEVLSDHPRSIREFKLPDTAKSDVRKAMSHVDQKAFRAQSAARFRRPQHTRSR